MWGSPKGDRFFRSEPECYPQSTMIQLELQPEIEAQLAAEAQARGLALENPIGTADSSVAACTKHP